MLSELFAAVPLALLFSLPVSVVGGIVLVRLRRHSLTATMVALVLVPLVAALVGVLGVSGFMYTPQLLGTVVVCVVVGVVTVPAVLLLSRRVAREAMWQREALAAERLSEESRRRLVAGMSHDLRSPLAGICGMADALVDGVVRDPDEVSDYLARIRREASRMTAMVEGLFQLSRATSGTLQLTLEPLVLAEVASDAVAAVVRPTAADEQDPTAVTVEAVDPEEWPMVLGSDPDLTRVLRNVVANAVAHTRAGGTVRVSAGLTRPGQGGTRVWLRVDDACGGIPDDDLPRLFEVGYRGGGARTPTEHSGAGLGLAIARGLMHAQDGEITIANHGEGCRTELTLAAAAPVRPARTAPALDQGVLTSAS